jgi:peptidoglycan-associated lipoprotein
MRKKLGLVIALGMILSVIFFTASCSKKQVAQFEPTQTTQPEVSKEVPKASVRSGEEAEQAKRLQEDRLRAEAAAREASETVFINRNVHFAFDSSVLSEQARQILKSKAQYLLTNPGVKVTVEGHCDDRGTDAYNMALGYQRAESAKDFLVDLGISADRMSTISYGEERPIAMGENEESWAKNRRAQFVPN